MRNFVSGLVLVLLVGLIVSCRSLPVDVSLYNSIKDDFGGFRFRISKSVTLTNDVTKPLPNNDKTVVIDTTRINIIKINASTTGRVKGNPTAERLEISFDDLNESNTFVFIQKEGGLYYFEKDSDGFVLYGGEKYRVTHDGDEEPYLKYLRSKNKKTTRRTLKGLR